MYATYDMFVAAMALFPEVQQRAQAELDSVIGRDRLPTLRDRANLPYVSALLLEVYRWKPVVPLGVTHRVSEEDEYRGFRIPRGTVTIQNPWYVPDLLFIQRWTDGTCMIGHTRVIQSCILNRTSSDQSDSSRTDGCTWASAILARSSSGMDEGG